MTFHRAVGLLSLVVKWSSLFFSQIISGILLELPNLSDQSYLSCNAQNNKTENPVCKVAQKKGPLFCLIGQVVSANWIQLRLCHSYNLENYCFTDWTILQYFEADPTSASSGDNDAFILYASNWSLTCDSQKVFTDGPFQPALFLLPLGLCFF